MAGDPVVLRVRELREDAMRHNQEYDLWCLYDQAKKELGLQNGKVKTVAPETNKVEEEHYLTLNYMKNMLAEVYAAISYLEMCEFGPQLSHKDYLNKESVRKALERLHRVIVSEQV